MFSVCVMSPHPVLFQGAGYQAASYRGPAQSPLDPASAAYQHQQYLSWLQHQAQFSPQVKETIKGEIKADNDQLKS